MIVSYSLFYADRYFLLFMKRLEGFIFKTDSNRITVSSSLVFSYSSFTQSAVSHSPTPITFQACSTEIYKPERMTQPLTAIEHWTKCLACYARNHTVELWLLGFPIPMILVGLASLGFNGISTTDVETLLTESGHDASTRKEFEPDHCRPLPTLPKPAILNQPKTSTSHTRSLPESKILSYWAQDYTISDIQTNLLLIGCRNVTSKEIIDVLVNAGYEVNDIQILAANDPWKKYQFFAEEIDLAEECSCAYSTAQVVDFWHKGYTIPDIAVQLKVLGYENVFIEDIRCQLSLVGKVPATRSEEKGAWRALRRKGGVKFRGGEM